VQRYGTCLDAAGISAAVDISRSRFHFQKSSIAAAISFGVTVSIL
jgi:hypothetical protein